MRKLIFLFFILFVNQIIIGQTKVLPILTPIKIVSGLNYNYTINGLDTFRWGWNVDTFKMMSNKYFSLDDFTADSVVFTGQVIIPDTVNINDVDEYINAPVYKTTSGTLSKTDRYVLASGDITLTAPAITAADSGLMITVKNIGTHTDLVLFRIDGTTADGIDTARLLRWQTRTIIAGNDGKWYTYEKSNRTDYVYDVSASGSFTTIKEVIEFLNEHMEAPSVVRLGGGDYPIDSRIEIDLNYPLTIRGFSYQTTFIYPSGSISGLPMFQCSSPVSFENFQADATRLAGYGDELHENFVTFASIYYHEIKNFYLKGFYDGIKVSSNCEIYVQEGDIEDCNNSGIMINSQQDSTVMRVVTTDFIGCDKGIHLYRGSKAYIDINGGCGFRNGSATDSAIVYYPTLFTNFRNIYISGTTWNNIGTFISGFDFTRSDGRDANAFITNNAGVESKNPHAYINVLNNATTTTVTTGNTYYPAKFTNTSSYTCKFTIGNNSMTYQPVNKRDIFMTISGNMSVNQTNRNLEVCVVKNGNTATRYGQMTVRTGASNTAAPFATSVYIPDATATDQFSIYVTSPTSGDVITVQDINWLTNSQ